MVVGKFTQKFPKKVLDGETEKLYYTNVDPLSQRVRQTVISAR